MEEQTKSQLWKKSEGQGHRLRRPHDNSDVTLPKGPSEEVNNETASKPSSSKLSAEAKEFYPANYGSASPAAASSKSPAQERLMKIIKDNQPPNQNDQSQKNPMNEINNMYPDGSAVDQDKRRLENMITTLIFHPGRFDDLLHLFVETFKPYLENHVMITTVAEMLVSESIRVPNFCYTGARLCKVIEEISPFFRSALHLICQKELSSKQHLEGLTGFLGELYSQLHYENIYGLCLLTAMNSLLQIGDDASVKRVCQVLKLTGYSLSLYNNAGLEDVFLKLLALRPNLAPSVANLLNAVLKLKSDGWGMTGVTSSNSSASSLYEAKTYWLDQNAVYYNPVDGIELGADEKTFFADHFEEEFNVTEDEEALSDPDELCDPEPEMDEEIQEAFKEFLKLSKQ